MNITKSNISNPARLSQRGLSLVELMVSLAIGLIIVLAASTAYLALRTTSTTLNSVTDLNETGKLAMDMIGRELQMAGFYPAIVPNNTGTTNLMGVFSNTKNVARSVYANGLFGCDGARFKPTDGTCPTAVANAPDSVVINYFAPRELDATTFASGFDCLRGAVSNDPENATQIANNRPLYVSNRFSLVDSVYTAQGVGNTTRTISTKSLACNGNGAAAETLTYQPVFDGIEDLVIRYGANPGNGTLTPERYYTAGEISAMLANADGINGWRRVTSVKVCLLARTLDNVRTEDKTTELRTYTNCRGNSVTYSSTDRTIYKRYERVFAIRNNLTGIF